MKISPNEKQQLNIASNATQQGDRSNGGDDFAKVLQDTVQKTSGPTEVDCNVMRTSMVPAIGGTPPVSISSEFKAAEGLLDALENYQTLLKDPQASLRAVEPAVEKMRLLSKSAEPIMNRLPEGHPIKTVVGEAMVHISKELVRFNQGHYVDRQGD